MKKLFVAAIYIYIAMIAFAESYTITYDNGYSERCYIAERCIGLGISTPLEFFSSDSIYQGINILSLRSRKFPLEDKRFTLGFDLDTMFGSRLGFTFGVDFGGALIKKEKFTLVLSGVLGLGYQYNIIKLIDEDEYYKFKASVGADVFLMRSFTKHFGMYFSCKVLRSIDLFSGISNMVSRDDGSGFSFKDCNKSIDVVPSIGVAWRI